MIESTRHDQGIPTAAVRGESWLRAAIVVAALLSVARWLYVTLAQLVVPFDLSYETGNLATIHVIRDGGNPYDPAIYADFPFVLSLYTPLLHYLVAALPQFASNAFLTGRIVTCLAMAGVALLIALGPQPRSRWFALCSVGLFLGIWPVIMHSAYLRCDPLALLLSVAAVVVAHRGHGRAGAAFACGVLCALALTCKQSFVAASLTVAVWFALTRPRCLAPFVAGGALIAFPFLALVYGIWGGPGFWFSTVGALRQPMTLEQGFDVLALVLPQPLLCILYGAAVAGSGWALRGPLRRYWLQAPYGLYFAASFVIFGVTIWRPGAGPNYVLESAAAALLLLTHLAREHGPLTTARRGRTGWLAAIVLTICIADLGFATPTRYSLATGPSLQKRAAHYLRIKQELARLGFANPWVLNIFKQHMLYALNRRVSINDPHQYRKLWEGRLLSTDSLVSSLERQRYDVIMVPARITAATHAPPPYDTILKAIYAHYAPPPDRPAVEGYWYLLRRRE